MDSLTQFIAPIVSLWVIHNAIFSSAALVNGMRETVVSGLCGRDRISVGHRKQIRTDWRLGVAATIVVCFIFAGIVAAVSLTASEALMRWAGGVLALYSFVCGVGFIICARGDDRLMRTAIDSPVEAENGAPAALAR